MSANEEQDHGASLGMWLGIVRRARIGREAKIAALTFASYANNDGTGIKCSPARLALDCEWAYSSARRHLAWLRKVGLVEMTERGNRRRGETDVYRLVLAPEILERLDVPDPDTYKKEIGRIQEANRSTQKVARRRRLALTQDERYSDSGDPVDNSEAEADEGDVLALTTTSDETAISAHMITGLALTENSLTCEDVPAYLPSNTSHKKETSHPQSKKASSLRVGNPRARAETNTEIQRSQMTIEDAARYAAASDVLFREPDLGLSIRDEIRAELGEDVPEYKVVIEAAERFQRRSA